MSEFTLSLFTIWCHNLFTTPISGGVAMSVVLQQRQHRQGQSGRWCAAVHTKRPIKRSAGSRHPQMDRENGGRTFPGKLRTLGDITFPLRGLRRPETAVCHGVINYHSDRASSGKCHLFEYSFFGLLLVNNLRNWVILSNINNIKLKTLLHNYSSWWLLRDRGHKRQVTNFPKPLSCTEQSVDNMNININPFHESDLYIRVYFWYVNSL